MTGGRRWRYGGLAAAVCCGVLALAPGGRLASAAFGADAGPVAVATSINLRPGDLPARMGWSPQQPSAPAALHRIDARWSVCYGGRYARVLADVASDVFIGHDGLSASSDVEIFPTGALAAADFGAFDRPRGVICAKTLIRQSFVSGSTAASSVAATLAPITSTAAGTGGTFAVRISVTTGGRHFVFDETVFLERRAEVTVSVIVGDTARAQAPPTGLERSLTGLLVGRARSAFG